MSADVERRRRFEAVAGEVYEPLQRFIRRRMSNDEAEDVFGDVLLTIWRRIDDVPADAALPWCYGVARRTLANRNRSRRRQLRLVERLTQFTDPAPALDPPEEHPELMAALGRLSASDREILRLWAWEDLEPREIAIVLDTSPNAVSLRLTRAKAKLARELGRQNRTDGGQIPG